MLSAVVAGGLSRSIFNVRLRELGSCSSSRFCRAPTIRSSLKMFLDGRSSFTRPQVISRARRILSLGLCPQTTAKRRPDLAPVFVRSFRRTVRRTLVVSPSSTHLLRSAALQSPSRIVTRTFDAVLNFEQPPKIQRTSSGRRPSYASRNLAC